MAKQPSLAEVIAHARERRRDLIQADAVAAASKILALPRKRVDAVVAILIQEFSNLEQG